LILWLLPFAVVAVSVIVPALLAVTNPFASTLAMAAFDVLHVTAVVAFDGVRFALNCC
jgi:hypothetical protein